MSTEFTTEGVIVRESSFQINWTWYEPGVFSTPRFISPKFRLPNCKNGDVDCHLFVDQTLNKFGIKNVSQDLGTVVISGIITTNDIDTTGKEGNFIFKVHALYLL